MLLEMLIVLASATQELPRYGTLATADQCATILSAPAILEREKEKARTAAMGMKYSEAQANAMIDDNLTKARAANLPTPTEEECRALK